MPFYCPCHRVSQFLTSGMVSHLPISEIDRKTYPFDRVPPVSLPPIDLGNNFEWPWLPDATPERESYISRVNIPVHLHSTISYNQPQSSVSMSLPFLLHQRQSVIKMRRINNSPSQNLWIHLRRNKPFWRLKQYHRLRMTFS